MLKIYNTLGRTLQEFKPIHKDKITFYHCGPTVYWTQHIGNLRGMLMGDLIRRSLQYFYPEREVQYVRNYTDFGHLTGDNIGDADQGEDRMEKAAKREHLSPKKIADKYIAEFEKDTMALNILEPTVKARATDYLEHMIKLVGVLLNKGFAYSTPKAIYFDVSKFPKYTEFSGRELEKNRKGAGVGTVTDQEKKNPEDFALWFFRTGTHAKALQFWPSPFESPEVENGIGFPGWHIECSAMAQATLGKTLDLHMGGIEHISIHHPNEIAQSESANGQKYVNYWVHNEHLLVDGEKMSKSLGNVYSLDNLVVDKGYDPMHLRYFFLQAHYRSKQNFTFEALEASKKAYQRLIHILQSLDVSDDSSSSSKLSDKHDKEFQTNLEDDFNIPQALATTWDLLKSNEADEVKLQTILKFDEVLGLRLMENGKREEVEVAGEVKKILEDRAEARKNGDWMKSDELRDLLKDKYQMKVKDTTGGQEVEKL